MADNIPGRYIGAIDITIKAFGVYLVILFSIAIAGLLISRRKHKPEHIKGFQYALAFCVVLTLVYLKFMFGESLFSM
jgi:hypothetical protein